MDIRKFTATIAGHGAFVARPAGVLGIVLAAALTVWLFAAGSYHKEATGAISKSLITINKYKTEQITEWVRRHEREAARLSRHPFLGEIVSQEISRPGSRRAQLSAWLLDHTNQKRYIAMAFLTTKGAVIAATPKYAAGTEAYFKEAFAQASRTGKPRLTDLYLAGNGQPRMAMLSPISEKGPGGRPVCVLVIKIDPEMEFYPLLKAAPLFFTKAETLLVRREGDQVLFLSELDFAKDSALKFKVPLSKERLPSAAALLGYSGFYAGVDYRGGKVFSAISHIEDSSWALITKIDRSTVLGPVKAREYLALALIVLAALMLYGLFYAVLRIREQAVQKKIQEGELRLQGAEASLQESEQIFREFMEHSPIYVFFKDAQIRPIKLSRNYEKMLGRPLQELLGKSMEELFPSELARSMVADDKLILKEGKEVEVEEQLNGRTYRTIKFPIVAVGKPQYLAGYTIDITAQKQAEEQVTRINERLLLAARAGHLGIWDWDVPSNKLVWDDRMFELYGIKKEAFAGAYEAWLKAIHPDDQARCEEQIQQALRGEKEYAIDFRITLPDGTGKHIKANGDIFRDAGGKPLRMVGVNLDITERKLAEEELAFNASRVNTQLRLNQMTEASEKEITDFALEEAVRLTNSTIGYLAFVNEDESLLTMHSWSRSAMAECATTEKPFIYSVKSTGLWGEAVRQRRAVITNDYTAPSPLKKGCPQGHVALKRHMNVPVFSGSRIVIVAGVGNKAGEYVNADIQHLTLLMESMWRLLERKRAIDALRRSEERFQQLFQTMEEGFATHEVVCDAAGTPVDYRFIDVNPAFERLTGLKKADIAGRTVLEVMPGIEKIWIENYGRVALSGKPMHFESGAAALGKWYEVSAFSPGKGQFAVSFFDITERKQSEAALNRLNKDLVEKTQEMENFLYITTHDLRSPLVNIQGFSQNLQSYLGELKHVLAPIPVPGPVKNDLEELTGGKIPRALDFVLQSSRKMDALISALLKVSRLGRVEMKPETLEMNGLIDRILASMRFQLEEAGATVKAGALPPCKADGGALTQLFSNLLDNAIKYRQRERALMVTVAGEVKGDMVLYTVADNGAGIPEIDLSRIWNVFYRHERTRDAQGEGIGLPMVRRITEKNGGSIRVESKENAGTTFYIELPAAGGK